MPRREHRWCQLSEPGLIEVLSVATRPLGSTRLHLEVAESAAIEGAYSPTVIRNLGALQELGVGITIDNFGTAHPFLGDVIRLLIDELQLDRSLVGDLDQGYTAEVISAVVGIARWLKIQVLAVGVETEQRATSCRELGCDRAQGMYFGRPEHPATPTGQLERGRSNSATLEQ